MPLRRAERREATLPNLAGVCGARGLPSLGERLADLAAWARGDLAECEAALAQVIGNRATARFVDESKSSNGNGSANGNGNGGVRRAARGPRRRGRSGARRRRRRPGRR